MSNLPHFFQQDIPYFSSHYSILIAITLPFLFSLFCAATISRIGHRLALIDNPNIRSSHSLPTPRGGGIGIWLAFVIIGVFFFKDNAFTLIAGIAGLIGLLEDLFTLSSKLRLLIQIIISALIAWLFLTVPLSMITVLLFVFWIIFITGTANLYNFMDGINGIAGFTGVVGFGLIAYFSYYIVNDYNLFIMSLILTAGCIGFLPFNFPKAKVFMGDVGSIFLGFVFASFVVKLSVTINIFLCLIMFLCTFYADAVITIYSRWRRGENLMQAHRSHLYQYLSNELKLPHWKVTLLYAVVQLCFGAIAVAAYQKGLVIQLILLLSFSIVFLVSYNLVKTMKPRLSEQ